MIESGDKIPSVPVKFVDLDGTTDSTSDAVLGQGLVVFFTVPGAYTPTCHVNHLPGFLANAAKLKAAGVSRIVCGAVNDHHVVRAWAEASDALGAIGFIADPHATLAVALGLDRRTDDLGLRYRRGAMIIRDGIAEAVFIEDKPGVTATGAPAILMALEVAAA
jgi:peroxiredoxin